MPIVKFETRFGMCLAMSNDSPIADSLAAYGEWAQIEIEFLAQFIPDDGVILDCGSHIGFHSLAFAHASERAHVHAFEPQPQRANLLKENIAAFGNRIIVHECAVGAEIGTGFIGRSPHDRDVRFDDQRIRLEAKANNCEVAISTIDSFDLREVKFIKLDVEGSEASALRGAARSIAVDRPAIYCQISSIGAAADLFQVMGGEGYQPFFVSTPGFNPENFHSASVDVFDLAHESGLLLLPVERPSPYVPRNVVCLPVPDVDEFARLFFNMPRFRDETRRDYDWEHLKQNVPFARCRSTAQIDSLEREIGVKQQQLFDATAQIGLLSQDVQIEKQRYRVLAEALRKYDFSTRRRSVLGAAARRFGRSELAKACRTLTASGLFDRKWYKTAYPDVSASTLEPVAHYILFGAFEGRKPNRAFDSAYYLSENSDVRRSGINPLLHYIRHGADEMRRPSADFDAVAYLEAHPSLKGSPNLLLKHFLESASAEPSSVRRHRPSAPDWSEFETLTSKHNNSCSAPPLVDVLVPIYRGYDDTLACIYSVLSSRNATPFELIVIDDASPEPALSEALCRLADMGLITLLRNRQNLGFVGTVNRGMALHESCDVLLLNSDTLVFNDWLDRIRAHGRKPRVASVTPFTNNGTICSYPVFCQDNPAELEVTFSELDRIAAGINCSQFVEVPTGVGFCMYIPREALNRVGYFDVETFGKGYGEENDFCCRASECGMRNVHALDVFVFHSGETSFGAGASKAKELGLSGLIAKHPGYLAAVQRYVAADPSKKAREKLDIGRLLKGLPERSILCFTHSLGGGVERYLLDRAASGRDRGEKLMLAIPYAANGAKVRLTGVDGRPALHNLTDFDIDADREALGELLQTAGVTGIEVHSTVGWSARLLQAVPALARSLGIPFDFMAHDYVSICPRITLINDSGIYCGEEGELQCRRCLNALPQAPSKVHPDFARAEMRDITEWRAKYKLFLEQAREVAAPSNDTARRLHRYFQTIDVVRRPHNDAIDAYARHVAASFSGDTLRVVVIGAIGSHKGSDILLKCVEDAERRRLPIHFTVVGYTNIPALNNRLSVNVTGPYAEHEVFDRLAEASAHVALFPSVCPETYSYTLTIALKGGFPVCVFDIGAPAERLRARADSIVLPVSMMRDASGINDSLIAAVATRGNLTALRA